MKKEQELREAYERGVQAAREEWARNAFQRGYEDEMRRLRELRERDLEPRYYDPWWKYPITCEGGK